MENRVFNLLISFVAYMDRVNLSVATPVIMQEFGFTKIDMGFIQTCFFASYALMQVPGGILAEKFGMRTELRTQRAATPESAKTAAHMEA